MLRGSILKWVWLEFYGKSSTTRQLLGLCLISQIYLGLREIGFSLSVCVVCDFSYAHVAAFV